MMIDLCCHFEIVVIQSYDAIMINFELDVG